MHQATRKKKKEFWLLKISGSGKGGGVNETIVRERKRDTRFSKDNGITSANA